MTKMLKGEIIFQWKHDYHKTGIECLTIIGEKKEEVLHTFSFPIDKALIDTSSQESYDAYAFYFRNFINNWAKEQGILSANPNTLGYEVVYREFGGSYKFRVWEKIDIEELANSLWLPFVRDLSIHITNYKTESVDITIDYVRVYSETEKEHVIEKFGVRIAQNFFHTNEEISIKGKPLCIPIIRSVLSSITEEAWPFEYRQELLDSIRYVSKDAEPIDIIKMKGRMRKSSTFVKKLIHVYKEFGKNPKKFLDRYKPEIGITSLVRMMRSE